MKHTMKVLAALALALCLILSLCACASKSATDAAPPIDAPELGKPADAPAPGVDEKDPSPKVDDKDPAPGADEKNAEGEDEKAPDGEAIVEFALSGKDDSAYGFYGEGSVLPAPGSVGEGSGSAAVPAEGDPGIPDSPAAPGPETPRDPGEALKLTAAEWNDNRNWPFFTNLVNAGTVSFPSFGIDPRHRIEVRASDAAGTALANLRVSLLDGEGKVLWTARTDKAGVAYLFYAEGQSPDRVVCGEASAPVQVQEGGDAQNPGTLRPLETVELTAEPAAPQSGMQVLFIVDTTGSMADEIAYLQKDFSAIAGRVGGEDLRWAVSFYRDEGDDYVTRHSDFSSDVAEVQRKINAEYADGGGDEPEAVAQVLRECLSERSDWDENTVKLAFLIFDAPPHEGKDAELQAAVKAAAEKGIRLIPVVASNANRETELFGRALAICTNGSYVFLTDDSGVGDSHLEPIVGDYEVELLQDLIVRIIEDCRP